MNDPLRELLLSGFMIYPCNGKFIVKKEKVPSSDYGLAEKEFNTYIHAVDYAIKILQTPRLQFWSVVLRYNRGLGIEYKNFSDVYAASKDEAVILANEQVESILKEMKIKSFEIKVKLKNDS